MGGQISFYLGDGFKGGVINRGSTLGVSPSSQAIRDTIHTKYKLFNKEFILIDTAGIRRKTKVNEDLELGFEHYSGFGPLRDLQGWNNQSHTVYATADFKAKGMEVNFGVGRGYHNGEDDWVVKSIIAFPFN